VTVVLQSTKRATAVPFGAIGPPRIQASRVAEAGQAALPLRTRPIAPVRATATTITLSPRALAHRAGGSGIIVSGRAAATAVPNGGGSSNTALGLAALIGAGGIALFRARLLASAAGIDDAGTLTALGHSAATFWAGSCYSVGSGSTTASLAAERISGAVRGDRARFGVGGVASGAANAAGGRIALPAAPLAGTAAGDDPTRIVAMLLAASAIIGAALGALGPRRQTSGVDAG
jgi:hypothetical protein